MPLNPFFIQGTRGEQRLVQDLINEQLKIYGVEIIYIPRKYVTTNTVIKENILAKFDEGYAIEAYVMSYQGFGGSGDLLTKFGVQSKDELSLAISRERYEDFISPFLTSNPQIKLSTRPAEGDLIYFPLSDIIYEIKFVEHETEFYQLNKLYIYELRCEPFEYEDEIINTGIDDIDDNFLTKGSLLKLTLVGIGSTATAITSLRTGSLVDVYITSAGYNYTSVPTVAISTSPSGGNASGIASMTRSSSGKYSVNEVIITNPGYGYTRPPLIRFIGGGGTGAAATAGISTLNSVGIITITSGGSNYINVPSVTFVGNVGSGQSAIGQAQVTSGIVTNIYLLNAGFGYTTTPSISISSSSGVGTGNFSPLETVTGSASSVTAIVKNWDYDTKILYVSNVSGKFQLGEVIYGSNTLLQSPGIGNTGYYTISQIEESHDMDGTKYGNEYRQNEEIEFQANDILDFTERNPFGEYGDMGGRF